MLTRTSESKGFTLIELLVVIAIIGILASIVLASLNTARKKGRDARRVADMKQVQLALELYYDGHSSTYPAVSGLSGVTLGTVVGVSPDYISTLPTDPNGAATPYIYQSTDNAVPTPAACTATPCLGYLIRAVLETGTTQSGLTGTIAGVACTPTGGASNNYCVKP